MLRSSLTAAAIVVLFPLALLAQQPPPSAMHGHHGPLPKPVNLKVLPKDISPQDLMKIMHGFTGDLGVHCSFCHVEDEKAHTHDFASDAKPEKNTARIMIQMTQAINGKYLAQISDPDLPPEGKSITCGTCHRGHNLPETFTPPQEHHEAAPKP